MPAASALAAAAAAAGLLLGSGAGADVVLTMQDPEITESSGLAVSGRDRDLVWTEEDGGQVAQVLGLDAEGDTVSTVTLAGIDPYDPEALAPGVDGKGRPLLYLGDIGDNNRERPDVSVFRFREPAERGDTTVEAQWYRFTYPDGPHDAEALLVGPGGRIMIATKGFAGAGLYQAPKKLVTADEGSNRLTRVGTVPALVTDGAYLADGSFVLRTYASVTRYHRPGEQVAHDSLPPQPQGESVAADGDRLLVGSEGQFSEVLAVPVPGGLASPSPGSSSATGTPAPSAQPVSGTEDGWPVSQWALAGVGVLVLLTGALVAARRRRRG